MKIVNDFKPVTIFTKRPISDIQQGSEYAFAFIFKSIHQTQG